MAGQSLFEIPVQVAIALTLASNATGADLDYLTRTAARESNFKPAAVARTSSARGLFQFIESTWLRSVKDDGPAHGLGHFSARIFKTRSGRYYVPEDKDRRTILALRHNPRIAALMAGEFAQRNRQQLRRGIGRNPSRGELYIAHFLGSSNAIRLIKRAEDAPNRRADRVFPRAARANRTLFFRRGRPLSVLQVYRLLITKFNASGHSATTVMRRITVKPGTAAARGATRPGGSFAAPLAGVPLPANHPSRGLAFARAVLGDGRRPYPVAVSELLRGTLHSEPALRSPVSAVAGVQSVIFNLAPGD